MWPPVPPPAIRTRSSAKLLPFSKERGRENLGSRLLVNYVGSLVTNSRLPRIAMAARGPELFSIGFLGDVEEEFRCGRPGRSSGGCPPVLLLKMPQG
jgi:hypothetical protein